MVTIQSLGEDEKKIAEQIIATTAPFPGVRTVLVELGEDHSGDPSMSLIFKVEDGVVIDEGWIQQFNAYATALTLKLIHSGLKRFPYTRLESAA